MSFRNWVSSVWIGLNTGVQNSKNKKEISSYHIKINFLGIIIPKFMKVRQLFQAKNVCKNFKNQHV